VSAVDNHNRQPDDAGSETHWEPEGTLEAPTQPDSYEPTTVRLAGVFRMFLAGASIYAFGPVFSHFSDQGVAIAVGMGLSYRAATAYTAIAMGSCLSVVTLLALAFFAWRLLVGGLRRFFVDNEEWIERFAEGGKPDGPVHAADD